MKILPVPVRYTPLGFRVWHGRLMAMNSAHRHDEIEIGVVSEGSNILLFGGRRLDIPVGQLTVFWGAIPHQVLKVSGQAYVYSLTVPLAWVLSWKLPESLVQAMMQGRAITDQAMDPVSGHIALLKRWKEDLDTGNSEDREIVLLELQACLRRLARRHATPEPVCGPAPDMDPVARMAAHLAAHYQEPFDSNILGRVAGMHPRSAMRLFRNSCGFTLLEHVTFHRVAHAQRLLATSNMKVIDIAQDSGFASLSRFYVAFSRVCGQTPKAYRRQVCGIIA